MLLLFGPSCPCPWRSFLPSLDLFWLITLSLSPILSVSLLFLGLKLCILNPFNAALIAGWPWVLGGLGEVMLGEFRLESCPSNFLFFTVLIALPGSAKLMICFSEELFGVSDRIEILGIEFSYHSSLLFISLDWSVWAINRPSLICLCMLVCRVLSTENL